MIKPVFSLPYICGAVEVVPGQVSRIQADKMGSAGSELGRFWPEWRADTDFFLSHKKRHIDGGNRRHLQPLLVQFRGQQLPCLISTLVFLQYCRQRCFKWKPWRQAPYP